MEAENKHSTIIQTIEKFLNALDINGTVSAEVISEKKVRINITVSDGQQGYIIGKQGMTLFTLQYIVSLLARKEQLECQYQVDINNYQEEKDEAFVKRVADYVQAKNESTELLLWPMTGYERRLVHEYYLRENTYTTESENFGNKRVVRLIKK